MFRLYLQGPKTQCLPLEKTKAKNLCTFLHERQAHTGKWEKRERVRECKNVERERESRCSKSKKINFESGEKRLNERMITNEVEKTNIKTKDKWRTEREREIKLEQVKR